MTIRIDIEIYSSYIKVHFPYLDFPVNHSCSFTIDGLTWKHWEYILYARTPVKTNVSLSRKNLRITRAKRFFMLFIHSVIEIISKESCIIAGKEKNHEETHVKQFVIPYANTLATKIVNIPWFKWNLICKKFGILKLSSAIYF